MTVVKDRLENGGFPSSSELTADQCVSVGKLEAEKELRERTRGSNPWSSHRATNHLKFSLLLWVIELEIKIPNPVTW